MKKRVIFRKKHNHSKHVIHKHKIISHIKNSIHKRKEKHIQHRHKIIHHIRHLISKKSKQLPEKNIVPVPIPIKKENKFLIITYKILTILLVISLIGYIIFFSNIIKRDCGNDVNCFNQASMKCSGAKLEALKDTNVYEYTIFGQVKGNCIIGIKLKKMAVGTPVSLVKKIEGKSMECGLPVGLLQEKSLDEMDNLVDYCSGRLKESIYEVLIDKMYALIIKNMANITKSVEKDILNLS